MLNCVLGRLWKWRHCSPLCQELFTKHNAITSKKVLVLCKTAIRTQNFASNNNCKSYILHILFLLKNVYVRGRVKNYPQCRYMLCSWLHCWLGMMRYTWSTCLLLLWCRCDLDSQFMSWVLCHKLGPSTFHLHQRRTEGSDSFFMGWRCTRCQNA
jgi:hypothetical protein